MICELRFHNEVLKHIPHGELHSNDPKASINSAHFLLALASNAKRIL